MRFADVYPNRIFGLVKNKQGTVIYKTSGFFMDSVIDSVKSAAIANWTSGELNGAESL